MSPIEVACAPLVPLLWGFQFVVIKVGLTAFPPLFFLGLRFAIIAALVGDGIFALKFGEALLVKTVVCRGKDAFDLVSDNPACGNIHVDLTKDGDHLNVIGRVAARWRTL